MSIIITYYLKTVAIVCFTAYPITKIKNFKRALQRIPTHSDIFYLSILFSIVAILGNVFGEKIFDGAMVNSGIIAPIVGGLIAGPVVGIFSGFLSGLYLYFFLGGFSVKALMISNILAGVIGGLFYKKFNYNNLKFLPTFFVGIIAEVVSVGCILLFSNSMVYAELYVRMLSSISIIVNSLGVAIFISIIKDIQTTNYLIGYNYAQQSLAIVSETLPLLEKGFNKSSSSKISKTIFNLTNFDAVAITDTKGLLALSHEDDFDISGIDFMKLSGNKLKSTSFSKKYFYINNLEVIKKKNVEHDFSGSVISAPITCNDELIGYIKAYKKRDVIDPPGVKIITGIADILSLQVQSITIAEQTKLRKKSEFEALKAQINPHFLFNTLSIIKLLIRTNPSEAQNIILKLSSLLRNTLYKTEDLVLLSKEIEIVELYLSIQKARFPNRLEVEIEIDEKCNNLLFPPFVIQPIVENSMNHAFFDLTGIMKLSVNGYIKDNNFHIIIKDNGKGIPENVIEAVKKNKPLNNMGIGLTNINRRLSHLYLDNYIFDIRTSELGTEIEIVLFSILE